MLWWQSRQRLPGKIAVKFNDVAVARHLMQAVHILGNDGLQDAEAFQVDQPRMSGVGPGRVQQGLHVLDQHVPHGLRIVQKCIDMGDFHGVDLFPQAAFAAKRGDAAFHGDAGAGHGHDPFGGAQNVGGAFNQVRHGLVYFAGVGRGTLVIKSQIVGWPIP